MWRPHLVRRHLQVHHRPRVAVVRVAPTPLLVAASATAAAPLPVALPRALLALLTLPTLLLPLLVVPLLPVVIRALVRAARLRLQREQLAGRGALALLLQKRVCLLSL